MRGMGRPLGLAALAAALFVLVLGASPAKAEFGIAEWEAITCKENVDTPAEFGPPPKALVGLFPLPEDPGQCNKNTPEKWYTQAAGHPPFGITDFTLNTLPAAVKGEGFPDGFIKDIVVDTPEGLNVNPEATPVKCTVEQLSAVPGPTCPPASLVGFNYFTVAAQSPPCDNPDPVPDRCANVRAKVPVFNLVPFEGVPSMVGFPTSAPGEPTIIVGDLDPRDQHVRFVITNIHAPDGTPQHPPIVGSRLTFLGRAGDGTYLTMPSNCAGGQTSLLFVRSHEGDEDSASFTTAVGASGCDIVPFNPGLAVDASGATDSPEPATVDVQMPEKLEPGVEIDNSHLLTAKVTLPEGAGLNPSVANGLVPCTDVQFKKGTDDPVECPASSRIGSIEVVTRALDQPLGGDVYVAEPTSSEPSSGNQFRVFLHAFNNRYGVNVRLIGHVFPNLETGQLKVEVPDNPQAPFNSFKVHLDGGARGALTSPDTCGPHTTRALYTPWSRPNEEVPREAAFTLATAPDGGPCAKTLAERPFNPRFSAQPRKSKAGAFTPFDLHITRVNGEQEIKRVDVHMPPGMVAKLKGVEYCPEARIDEATKQSGAAAMANPACPGSSFVGTTSIAAGSGEPFHSNGNVYLAGPYKDAPVSLVFVTPAVAGPYDLGTVVVRVALNVNPETAEVNPVSDPIPHIFGGVKLDIRNIDVAITRDKFTVNPTSCRKGLQVGSGIFGGGGNPLDPAAWFEAKPSSPFQATKCRKLKFEPKFTAEILGGENQTRRAANPKFRATLKARKGDANVARAAFILPRATILDQSHIRTICTRVQLAAEECPRKAIYGNATATSPLLKGKLKGPVYLTSSNNELPDLLVDLQGQVNVRLRGVISSENGRLKTVFRKVPDVAVTKFVLTMKGGNRGLLVNSQNLCDKPRKGFLNLRAQNSRRDKGNLRLQIKGCG
jgi:hypothetical protein